MEPIEHSELPPAVALEPMPGILPLPSAALPQGDAAAQRQRAQELRLAHQIQQSVLPKKLPRLCGFGLAAYSQSAGEVGGDFYDAIAISEDVALLAVADVMGKGVPAAIFAAELRALLRTLTEWTHRPSELLRRMNRLLFEELSGVDMYITAQLVLVEAAQRRLTLSSAGHCPLLLASCGRAAYALSPEGVPLGILGNAGYAEEVCLLPTGFCALMYTDGLTEARNPEGLAYGQERLQEWLTASRNLNETAGQLQARLLAEFGQFQDGQVPRDDQTLVVLAEELADSRAFRQAA